MVLHFPLRWRKVLYWTSNGLTQRKNSALDIELVEVGEPFEAEFYRDGAHNVLGEQFTCHALT